MVTVPPPPPKRRSTQRGHMRKAVGKRFKMLLTKGSVLNLFPIGLLMSPRCVDTFLGVGVPPPSPSLPPAPGLSSTPLSVSSTIEARRNVLSVCDEGFGEVRPSACVTFV
eukprot:835530-Prorocentrum_minimum.AAC.4